MIVRTAKGISGPIAFGLAILLVVLVVGAGFLWLREAEARLEAEQELARVQDEYKELQTECSLMQGGQTSGGVQFGGAQDPVIAGLSAQADLPQCEQPTIQPYKASMKSQDEQFFAAAQEGDMVVSYPANQLVYLYRPESEMLLNQARLASGPPQPGSMGQ